MKETHELEMEELQSRIAALPVGWISEKNVKGNTYLYHCRTVKDANGKSKKVEQYISTEEAEILRAEIAERKELEARLKSLRVRRHSSRKLSTKTMSFSCNVIIGDALRMQVSPVKKYKKRELYGKLEDYLYGDSHDKVLILYGLRRTGKTTMIRQAIADMSEADFAKTAFVQISEQDNLAAVNKDLKVLQSAGYRYIFFDEITLMKDFIEGAALLSDIYASCGMKIVLSGTDSLGFMLSVSDQLYDRCFMVHTTFIPYREFDMVLGIKGIDEYIRYGGTMSLSGVNYNENFVFASKAKVNDYVDTAIARNIQHSLKYYQDGGHFRHLIDLYENNELTSAINRVIEDINHRFTIEVLTRDFSSNDLAISARNLRRDRKEPTSILDDVDSTAINERIRKILDILNRNEQSVSVDQVHADEIREYLKMLDLIYPIENRSMPHTNDPKYLTVISQPGMRYAQSTALIDSLMQDEIFNELSLPERNSIIGRIVSEIKGRMMEDIVLLETKLAHPKMEVFKLQFAVGEFDMVIFDPKTASCTIYEIKHSEEAVPEQFKHLADEEKCKQTAFRYGTIKGKFVIYRGEDTLIDGIQYLNVEKYLKSLSE